jgi:hypothetical protein
MGNLHSSEHRVRETGTAPRRSLACRAAHAPRELELGLPQCTGRAGVVGFERSHLRGEALPHAAAGRQGSAGAGTRRCVLARGAVSAGAGTRRCVLSRGAVHTRSARNVILLPRRAYVVTAHCVIPGAKISGTNAVAAVALGVATDVARAPAAGAGGASAAAGGPLGDHARHRERDDTHSQSAVTVAADCRQHDRFGHVLAQEGGRAQFKVQLHPSDPCLC